MAIEESLVNEIDAAAEEVDLNPQEQAVDTEEEQVEKDVENEDEVKDDGPEAEGDVTKDESNEDAGEPDAESESDAEGEEKPTVSDDTLMRAVRAGLTIQQARNFRDDESLSTVCNKLEESTRELDDARRAAEAAKKTDTEEEEGKDPLAIFDNLNTDEFEPEVVEMLGTLAGQIRSQHEEIKQLRSGTEQTMQASQEAAAREVEDWFDGQVDALGDDFKEALGDGAYKALQPGSPQLAKRDALAEHMAVTLAGYQAMGKTPPSREELFQQSSRVVLRQEMENAGKAKIQGELARRKRQHIQRASSSKGQTLSKGSEHEIADVLNEKYFSEES